MIIARFTRRHIVAGLAAATAYAALARPALAAGALDATEFGLDGTSPADQTAALQAALDAARERRTDLLLPPGTFHCAGLNLPGNMRIIAVPALTRLMGDGQQPVGTVGDAEALILDGIGFGTAPGDVPALAIESASGIAVRNCTFSGAAIGISAWKSDAIIESCRFHDLADAAIHSMDSAGGLIVRNNRIGQCGNAGIRIWREQSGHDGSIVNGNVIDRIDWKAGGNGQNGNGVNVYQADGVIVSDNVISDCAFTAVRVNAGRNTQIRGNTCRNSGEVAIFSEFGFSGSIVADNIVDGAATGIDITNLDTGGYLATCTGNIVRNIFPRSAVNPDTVPVGIYAEADTVVANNVIENVPGVGIAAGYGPYVRNVAISGNVLTGCAIGIGVTVVDSPDIGAVRVDGNIVSGATTAAIAGMEWQDVVSPDLAADAANYRHVSVADNTVS